MGTSYFMTTIHRLQARLRPLQVVTASTSSRSHVPPHQVTHRALTVCLPWL
jgi:hypothetical protein